jgi:CDP-glucose 4,6-dehydratase
VGKDYSLIVNYPLGQHLRQSPGPLLLTGHTGFKGTWMTFLLEQLNIPIVGYSLPAEGNSLFERAERTGEIPEVFADIRDYETLENFVDSHRPTTIIHMAAQPLVLKSYESPRETFETNVMGTVNLLDIAFKRDFVKAVIIVTTDKVYQNDNSGRAFIETDSLKGKDPYSASKVGTEAVVRAWQQISFLHGGPKIASVRAGNVIGGGDFAADRIFPDLVRAVITGKNIKIRNLNSTRPWQHVLDPLVGYILVAEKLLEGETIDCVNFGPDSEIIPVGKIIKIGMQFFPELANLLIYATDTDKILEADNLQLNSRLASELLEWRCKWKSEDAIRITFEWWKTFLDSSADPATLCLGDINNYFSLS